MIIPLKKIAVFLFLFFVPLNNFSQTVNPVVVSVLNDMSPDSLNRVLREISGDTTAVIGGQVHTIYTRWEFGPDNDLAAQYIQERLTGLGLSVTTQMFSGSGKNILAEQTGTKFPERKLILCAHYDTQNTPGADDNATGIAAVLEAARILSNYTLDNTIVFALFDQEELGLIGSTYYVRQVAIAGDSILGVVNVDMIGWDSNGDDRAYISSLDVANSPFLASRMNRFNSDYGIGLDTGVLNPGFDRSDHASFWYYGYGAIFLSEDFISDANPYYHTMRDSVNKLNLSYFEKCTRLALATISAFALTSTLDSVGISETKNYVLYQNYPNPFNSSTTIRYALTRQRFVRITIYNILGQEIRKLVDEEKPPGTYEVPLEMNPPGGSPVPSGIYFYRLEVAAFYGNVRTFYSSLSKKFIYIK